MSAAGIADVVGWGLSRGFRGMVRALPHRAARPLGAALGDLARRLDPRHPRVARYNLEVAMPALGPEERRRLIARCFRHFGSMLIDNVSLGRFGPVALCERLTLDGWHHLAAAEDRDRGTLIVSAHLGNWEVIGYALALYRGTTQVVARPTRNRLVERDLLRFRQRFGNRIFYKRGAARRMLSAIKRHERVAYVIDQRVHPNEGIETPFFGQTSFTSPLLAVLSLRTGAPVVPIFAYPEPPDRFRIVVQPPIEPPERAAGSQEAAVLELTLRYLEVIEEAIRRRPEMWLWMHERWRKH